MLYELAKHFSRSGDREKGYGYCIRAAEKAEGVFAAEQAIGFYESALGLAGRTRDQSDIAGLLTRIGDLYGLVSRFDDSLSSYLKSMDTETDPRGKAGLHRKMAESFLKMSRYDDGIGACDAGLSALPEREDCPERARLLLMKGWCHAKKGEYEHADRLFRQGLDLAGRLGLSKEIADARHNMGTMYWYRGSLDLAQENLEKSLGIREGMNDLRGMANTLMNLGSVHHFRGDLDIAFSHKTRSYELYDKVGDKFGMAAALNNIGISYYHKGDSDTCLEYYGRSLSIRRQIGDQSGITTNLHNIGAVLSDREEHTEAIRYFLEGLDINRRIGSKPGMIYDLCSLAEEYLTIGDNAKSMKSAEEAFQKSSEIGATGEEGWARRIIGKNHRDAGNFEGAMREMLRSLEIAGETQEREEIVKSHHDLGLLFKAMGDGGKAREHLGHAMSIAKDIDDAILISTVQEALDGL